MLHKKSVDITPSCATVVLANQEEYMTVTTDERIEDIEALIDELETAVDDAADLDNEEAWNTLNEELDEANEELDSLLNL